MRDRVFAWFAGLVTRRAGTIIIVCAVLTVALSFASLRIGMKTQIAEMLPKEIPQIEEFLDIVDDYQSAENIMIAIESPDRDVDAMKHCADDLAARLRTIYHAIPTPGQDLSAVQHMQLKLGRHPVDGVEYDTLRLVRRIDYKVNSDFVSQHGMIIQKTKDLENMVDMFGSLELASLFRNINDSFEREYIDDSESLTTLDGEGQAVQGLEGIRRFLESIERYLQDGDSAAAAEAVAAFVSGGQYFIAPDNSMLIMMLQPAVSFAQFEEAIYLGNRIDDTLRTARSDYPNLGLSRTGSIMYQIDENKAFKQDFGWSYLLALGLILILLVGSFRTWRNPFYSVVTLVVSLIWVTGIIALVMHYINMMSAGFGIVLIGLGIDFGIHFISGFRDGREQGLAPRAAIEYMYRRVGAGVMTGALTTAIVFFSMPLTGFKAYTQMGITMGLGIVTTLGVMMVLLPALIVWDNRKHSAAQDAKPSIFEHRSLAWVTEPLQFRFLGRIGKLIHTVPAAVTVLVACVALAVLSVFAARSLEWEYDMMKLQPVGTESEKAQKAILDKFDLAADNALVTAPDMARCREMVAQFKKIGNRTGLIGQIDAVTEFVPEQQVQQRNIGVIERFRSRLESAPVPTKLASAEVDSLTRQLERLHNNIVEIGELSVMSSGVDNKVVRKTDRIVGRSDEDSYVLALAEKVRNLRDRSSSLGDYQRIMSGQMKRSLLQMASTEMVGIDDLPQDIRMRYVNPNNSDLLITIYPKGYIWEERRLSLFNDVTAEVSERIT
ncbi:MAG: MMPL family transporter, partial [Chitinivibrionales bacterium]|nr:MMPL family transporter [Chitinivibrionales bacterium]